MPHRKIHRRFIARGLNDNVYSAKRCKRVKKDVGEMAQFQIEDYIGRTLGEVKAEAHPSFRSRAWRWPTVSAIERLSEWCAQTARVLHQLLPICGDREGGKAAM